MIMDKPIEKVDICERGILMKKLVCVCLSLALLVSLAACAAEETPEQRIERVMTEIFTCPDAGTLAYTAVIQKNLSAFGDDSAQAEMLMAQEALGNYLREKYSAADFTEAMYDGLYIYLYSGLIFPTVCAMDGIEIVPKSVSVELESASSRTYRYTAELEVKKDGGTVAVMQTGKAQVDGEGRISSFRLTGSALYDVILG